MRGGRLRHRYFATESDSLCISSTTRLVASGHFPDSQNFRPARLLYREASRKGIARSIAKGRSVAEASDFESELKARHS